MGCARKVRIVSTVPMIVLAVGAMETVVTVFANRLLVRTASAVLKIAEESKWEQPDACMAVVTVQILA